MGKAKPRQRPVARQGKSKAAKAHPSSGAAQLTPRSANLKTLQGRTQRKPRKKLASPRLGPLDDAKIQQVEGIPDEARIAEAAGNLSAMDRRAFSRTLRLLAEHLGSQAAARLWLITPSAGFVTTPLDAVGRGQAKAVLAMVEARLGTSPTYA